MFLEFLWPRFIFINTKFRNSYDFELDGTVVRIRTEDIQYNIFSNQDFSRRNNSDLLIARDVHKEVIIDKKKNRKRKIKFHRICTKVYIFVCNTADIRCRGRAV